MQNLLGACEPRLNPCGTSERLCESPFQCARGLPHFSAHAAALGASNGTGVSIAWSAISSRGHEHAQCRSGQSSGRQETWSKHVHVGQCNDKWTECAPLNGYVTRADLAVARCSLAYVHLVGFVSAATPCVRARVYASLSILCIFICSLSLHRCTCLLDTP